jgi:hypothetical protein
MSDDENTYCGGLFHLVAYGQQNIYVPHGKNGKNIVHRYQQYNFSSGRNVQLNICGNFYYDIMNIKDMYFKSSNLTLEQFKNAVKNARMSFQIGGNEIFSCFFDLLMDLFPVKQFGDVFVLHFPSEMTICDIPVIALEFHNISVEIYNLNHDFENIKLVAQGTMLDTEQRNETKKRGHELSIQQFQNIVAFVGDDLEQEIKLHHWLFSRSDDYLPNMCNLVKGFFISGNISNIRNFKIYLNNKIREDLDFAMINTYCRKINENTIFYSFDGKNDYENNESKSYIGALNASRIDYIKLKFDLFNRDQTTYKITALSHNIMRIMSGMGGVAYSDNQRISGFGGGTPSNIHSIISRKVYKKNKTNIEWKEEKREFVETEKKY